MIKYKMTPMWQKHIGTYMCNSDAPLEAKALMYYILMYYGRTVQEVSSILMDQEERMKMQKRTFTPGIHFLI